MSVRGSGCSAVSVRNGAGLWPASRSAILRWIGGEWIPGARLLPLRRSENRGDERFNLAPHDWITFDLRVRLQQVTVPPRVFGTPQCAVGVIKAKVPEDTCRRRVLRADVLNAVN